MQKVTAVILNYNSIKDCKKCISWLKKQDYDNFNIIVVDNNSAELNEKELLSRLCKDNYVELILNEKNAGFSAGNNLGLKKAVNDGAEWMLVINPDVELRDSHYISYVMEQLPEWPDVAVVGTNVVLPDGTKQNPMRENTLLEEIFWPFEFLKFKSTKRCGYKTNDITGYCEKVSGCCFFISSEFLKKNNYLDESVFMYCEEPILAKSVAGLGYKELYIKEVTANHEHYVQQKSGSKKAKMQMFIKNRIYYIQRYSDYSFVGKKASILSRRIQMLMWKCKEDKGKKI